MSRLLITCAMVVVLTAPGVAQTPQTPIDFSGTWALDESRSVSATHEGFVGPVTWTITQSAKAMIVDIKRGPKQFTLTFRLFEKPPLGPGSEGIPSYRGYWDGNQLVTETAQNIQGQTVTTKEIRTLLNGGREMLVERLVNVEHGYTLRGAQSYNTAKDYFRRVSP